MRRGTADRQAAKDAGKETQEKQTVPSCYLEQRKEKKHKENSRSTSPWEIALAIKKMNKSNRNGGP